MKWYLKVLQNYVNFQGRARRKEYWMFILFNAIFVLALSIVEMLLDVNILITAYSLVLLLPSLAVSVRRLHDTGRSGWFVLLQLIPIIGNIILIVFYCQNSELGENKYGADPKE